MSQLIRLIHILHCEQFSFIENSSFSQLVFPSSTFSSLALPDHQIIISSGVLIQSNVTVSQQEVQCLIRPSYMLYRVFFKIIFRAFLPLLDRTGLEWKGDGMACSTQTCSHCGKDISFVHGALALPGELVCTPYGVFTQQASQGSQILHLVLRNKVRIMSCQDTELLCTVMRDYNVALLKNVSVVISQSSPIRCYFLVQQTFHSQPC